MELEEEFDLIAKKVQGTEKGRLDQADLAFHEREYARLTAELERAHLESMLPDVPRSADQLNDLLLRLRMGIET